ncbi:MAG: host attachment protein [Pseudotabrizicola sp.]|uniref:baeRF12 domain-containing protein n=1 Tax=Pseudotabrizicola sp. TaxID=2939647 RepID=UPI00271E3472|nr:host attachment protein [Pseudotabrizicola sp.]MDO9637463.1 host attachment protein [Pseudotabrizicola sp.]
MTMITRGCWIVVVDGAGAVILENAGTVATPDLRLIDRIETPRCDTPPEPGDGNRPAEASDRARLAETAMVAMLMTRLSFAVRQSRTSRLAIAAPPHLLEAIRTRLDHNLRSRVAIMLPKTLTQHPLDKIVSVMAEAMERAA